MREISKKKQQIIKTFLAYAVIGLFLEVCVLLSWTGIYPSKYLVLLIAAIPFGILFGLVMFNPTRVILWNILLKLEEIRKECIYKLKQIDWKKLLLLFVGNLFVSVVLGIVLYGFEWRKLAFLFSVTCLISMVWVYREMLIKRIEIMVFCVIMIIGSLYATTMPVSCGISWDDETHFRSALVMSHYFDTKISVSDREMLNKFATTALEHDIYTKDAHEAWVEKINTAYETGGWEYVERAKLAIENLCYLPSALGLFIGRVLSLPYSAIFIFGRWCNLFAYALLVYFSMKKLRSGKMILATVALLPTCIFMASSYARDPWMIGFIMLGFSTLVGEIQNPDKKLKFTDMLAILVFFVLGIRPKAIYVPILLIAFFIPKEKFVTEKQYKYFRIVIILATLAILSTFLLPFIGSSGGGVQDNRGGSDVNAGLQTAYILSQPFTYANTLINFLKSYFSFDTGSFYLTAMHYFGTGGYAVVLQILLGVVIFTDHDKNEVILKWPFKVMTLFMSFGAICLAATAMYIAYTPVYQDVILGCQSRYMLQILFPTVFVLGNVRVENRMNQKMYRLAILGVLSFVLLSAIWTLFICNY